MAANRSRLTVLDVKGMTCQKGCASTVRKALLSVAGVDRARVEFADAEARVVGTAAPAELVEAVEDVGFEARVKGEQEGPAGVSPAAASERAAPRPLRLGQPCPGETLGGPRPVWSPGVWCVTRTTRFGLPGLALPVNMWVLRNDEGVRGAAGEATLTLVNAVRVDEATLAQIDALGRVTDLLRISDLHGADDGFYVARYDCRLWRMRGMRAQGGLEEDGVAVDAAELTVEAVRRGALPLAGATLFRFATLPRPEAVLLLRRGDATAAIPGDMCVNVVSTEGLTPATRLWMWLTGLAGPCRVPLSAIAFYQREGHEGPPLRRDYDRLLADDTPWEVLLPIHGQPCLDGSARGALRETVARMDTAGQLSLLKVKAAPGSAWRRGATALAVLGGAGWIVWAVAARWRR